MKLYSPSHISVSIIYQISCYLLDRWDAKIHLKTSGYTLFYLFTKKIKHILYYIYKSELILSKVREIIVYTVKYKSYNNC